MGSTQVIKNAIQHHLAPFCCLNLKAIEVVFVLSLKRPFIKEWKEKNMIMIYLNYPLLVNTWLANYLQFFTPCIR